MESTVHKTRKRLYTVEEAGEYMGRSAWSIRGLMYKGDLPCVRVGRRVHFDIDDLDKFVEKHKMQYTY